MRKVFYQQTKQIRLDINFKKSKTVSSGNSGILSVSRIDFKITILFRGKFNHTAKFRGCIHGTDYKYH